MGPDGTEWSASVRSGYEDGRGNYAEVEVKIENQIISSKIDLGWGGGVALPAAILHHLQDKTFIGRHSFCGLKGKIYESDVYELPQIYMGKMKIFPMQAKEENLEFVEDSILQKGELDIPEKNEGRIGWCVFNSMFHFFWPKGEFYDCAISILSRHP